jgi:hypothetical protein
MGNIKEGWNWLVNSAKEHYFVKGRSLCGKWGLLDLGACEQRPFDRVQDCHVCHKALLKRQKLLAESENKFKEG